MITIYHAKCGHWGCHPMVETHCATGALSGSTTGCWNNIDNGTVRRNDLCPTCVIRARTEIPEEPFTHVLKTGDKPRRFGRESVLAKPLTKEQARKESQESQESEKKGGEELPIG